jgi:helicase
MEVDELESFSVSKSVITRLKRLGYQKLTEVQELAIKSGLFRGTNLIISAPTNTGKTFIGELAALSASQRKDPVRTFYLVPLKALAEEKFQEFQEKYEDWGLRVAVSTRDRNEFDDELAYYDLIVATYEKLNSLLVRQSKICEGMGVVIVDEIQYIGDQTRGINLEILLTKLTTLRDKKAPQIIGLSATVPNASEIAEWLHATLVQTKTRDVDLREGILYVGKAPLEFGSFKLSENDLVFKEFNSGRVDVERNCMMNDVSSLARTCQDYQVIIFDKTRRDAEEFAGVLAGSLPAVSKITPLLDELDSTVEPTPISKALKKCLENGTAFHHAGLLSEERRLVEAAFRNGIVRVICSTPTLGAGINTPAKYVIIRSYTMYDGANIPTRDYKNMSGRAGRLQYHDDYGCSILFAGTEKELRMLWNNYVDAPAEKLSSQISTNDKIDLPIIQVVASGACTTLEEIRDFFTKTFFGYEYYQKSPKKLRQIFLDAVTKRARYLADSGFLALSKDSLGITELGKRCAIGLLSPESVKLLFSSLEPVQHKIQTCKNYEELIEPILHLVCSTQDARGALLYPPYPGQGTKKLQDYWTDNKDKFFYAPSDAELLLRTLRTTQMLLRWIDGGTFSKLWSYGQAGEIKRIAESISWILTATAHLIGKPLLEIPDEFLRFLSRLSQRVYYGVTDDAVEIVQLRIPAVHRARAMLLVKSGYKSLNSLIEAPIEKLEEIDTIGSKIAVGIKKHVEEYIEDENVRTHQSLVRRAKELGRDQTIVDRLYSEIGDNFSKACVDALGHMEVQAKFVGDIPGHDVDILIDTKAGRIVAECKRITKGLVSAKEAEEILGEGAKHAPVANVTIGYPDFSDEAIQNSSKTKIALITHSVIGEMLIRYWKGESTTDDMLKILGGQQYVSHIML